MAAESTPASSQDRILKALRDARARLEAVERERTEPIAIIGMGCRLPGGVNSPDDYWRLLRDGVDAMREVPADRWSLDEYYDPDPDAPGKMYAREAGFVDGIDRFDPQFFRISPREAISLDPQQRLLLECTWEALENAGQSADRVRGSQTGIFMGLSWHDYERLVFGVDPTRLDAYAGMGNTPSIAVGRLAFFLGVHGPVAQLDTACSASLVAVHQACQSLRMRECTMALAGGVNLMISPMSTVFCSKIRALSPTCRCHTFDAKADGYARGEGCGVVVLKRLGDAIANGDDVLAVIRGSAINHDGPSSGLTVPNRRAQRDVIRQALANGKVAPHDVAYVEAHGTGTSLGDPIEVGALGDALGEGRPTDRPLWIGSAKTNFGHLEAAAGVTGLMKAVLALRHGEIPAHLQFDTPNPNIDWEQFPVRVPTERMPWPAGPRIAGVSSFGFSGTNAHIVLEAAPAREATPHEVAALPQLVVLSAKSGNALAALAERFAEFAAAEPQTSLESIAFTTQLGRAHFEHRLAVVARDAPELAAKLRAELAPERAPTVPPGVVFLFTGQGAQWVGMGRELYEGEPVFRREFDRCAEILAGQLDRPLTDVVFGDAATSPLAETAFTQPALFALEWSLACLWRARGVDPTVVLGHSVGEYVAACVAGVFSLEDGLALIAERGRLMQALPRDGEMYAVLAAESQVAPVLARHAHDVSIAGVNGPRNVVISGGAAALREVVAELSAAGLECRKLDVSHAFHSPRMEPMLAEFEAFAARVPMREPQLRLISNVTAKTAGAELTEASYWRRHVREAVRFEASIAGLAREGHTVFVEVGPQPVLCGMARQCVDEAQAGRIAWLPSMRRQQPEHAQMQEALGALFVRGVEIDWTKAWQGTTPLRTALPTYPFERRRYWVETDASRQPVTVGVGQTVRAAGRAHPLLGARVYSAAQRRGECTFELTVEHQRPSYLADHLVFDVVIAPATMFHELAIAAGLAARARDAADAAVRLMLEGVVVHQPLILREPGVRRTVQCVLGALRDGVRSFEIASLDPSEAQPLWIVHAAGSLRESVATAEPDVSVAGADETGAELSVDDAYARLRALGLTLGASFRALTSLRRDGDSVLGTARLPDSLAAQAADHFVHPVLLDVCGQAITAAFPTDGPDEIHLPVGIDRLRVFGRVGATMTFRARLVSDDRASGMRTAEVTIFDGEGRLAITIEGATTRRAPRAAVLRGVQRESDWLYEVLWQPAAATVAEPRVAVAEWLLFADPSDRVIRALALSLQASGARVTVSDSAAQVTQRLAASPVQHIVVAAGDLGATEANENLDASHQHACATAIAVVQAVTAANPSAPPRLVLLTRGAAPVGEHRLELAFAPLVGLGRTIALEHPELRCTRIDLDPTPTRGEVEALVAELTAEGGEAEVALRAGSRFVPRLRAFAEPAPTRRASIQAKASYLVTGGLGALGLRVATWLASRGATDIVLIGRNPPNDRAIAQVASIESTYGAKVTTMAADVASRTSVQSVIATIRTSRAPLRGVIHAAGVLDDGALLGQSWSRFAAVLAPKVAGARHLDEATRDAALDFFVSFSSAASMLGSRGQSSYAAANAFLDALAHARRARGLPGLSVNWGPWAEVGMAAEMDERAIQRMRELGWDSIPPDVGLDLLDRLIGGDAVQVGVLPLDFERFVGAQLPGGQWPAFYPRRPSAAAAPVAAETRDAGVGVRDELLAMPERVARAARLAAYLQQRVGKLVGMDPDDAPDVERLFIDLGVDSLMHMELRNQIVRELAVQVPMGEFLARTTVASLAGLLLDHLDPDLAAPSADEGPALTRLPRDGAPFALSSAQERLWFLVQMNPDSAVYNLPNVFRLRGPLDIAALQFGVEQIRARHEVLRTTFREVDGRLAQVVDADESLTVEFVDLRDVADADEREAEAMQIARADAAEPFDLERGPLIRVAVLQLGDADFVLLLTLHHIVSDGWSSMVFLQELQLCYEAHRRATTLGQTPKAPELPELVVHYADYAAWERRFLESRAVQDQLGYWRQRLGESPPPVLALPTDRPRPAVVGYHGATHALHVSQEQLASLKQLGQREGVTLFMTLLAAFKVLLHRHSGQTEFVVGSPIAHRNRAEIENVIGCFINTLALRTDLSGEPSFRELLQRVRTTCSEAYRHQDVPFEKLVGVLAPQRDLSHSPLFQAMLILHVGDTRKVSRFGDVEFAPVPVHAPTSKFDVTLELTETGDDGLHGFFEYSTEIFDAATIARLAEHFENLLAAIVETTERTIGELPMLSSAERGLMLGEWNRTARSDGDFELTRCFHELFERQVDATPNAIALTFGDVSSSYRDLDERANRVAHWLREHGIGRDSLVAVCLERSAELLVALLGIAKAGAAYVPLDPAYPRDRIAYILEDARVAMLVTQADFEADFASGPTADMPRLLLDETLTACARCSAQRPTRLATPADLAYVIYTSGSTGRPKGVMIEHRALVNFLASMRERPGFGPHDVLVALTTISFDIAGLELYLPLVCGGRVVIADAERASDARRLAALLDASGATVSQATPATWQMLCDAGWRGRASLRILCGGEALPRELARRLLEPGMCAELWNMYGPTETTIWSACDRVTIDAAPRIGRPIANTELHVLDERLRLVPIGAPGELHIGGSGLARGYLHRDELTAERFIANPFAGPDARETRLYRTGDLVRRQPDGGIEFLGRTDHQVKVRGFRIELGEIETVLAQHPSVHTAVVCAHNRGAGDARLLAFYLLSPGVRDEPTSTELRKFLRGTLPDYMVPSTFTALPAFPMTPNGKIDRRALLADVAGNAADAGRAQLLHEEPASEMERKIAAIWRDVLGVERVGRHDNFFDLGGHSLLSMKVITALEATIDRRIHPREMFLQSLQQLAGLCERRVAEAPALDRVAEALPAEDPAGEPTVQPSRLRSLTRALKHRIFRS